MTVDVLETVGILGFDSDTVAPAAAAAPGPRFEAAAN